MLLLDTDICVAVLRGIRAAVEKVGDLGWEACSISIVTIAELYIGAYESNRLEHNLERITELISHLAVFPLENRNLQQFAEFRVMLRRLGTPIEDFDLMIASTAVVEDMTLVTNNVKHYQRIPGLRIEQWIVP